LQRGASGLSIYVIDANTVVSAVLNPNGTSRRALATARTQGTIALSEAVFSEIAEVLSRPKFTRVVTEDRRLEVLELLAAAAPRVDPDEKVENCRDAKDNRYLELALPPRPPLLCPGMRIFWCNLMGGKTTAEGGKQTFMARVPGAWSSQLQPLHWKRPRQRRKFKPNTSRRWEIGLLLRTVGHHQSMGASLPSRSISKGLDQPFGSSSNEAAQCSGP
jgi:putative PIN family toxin of toxin-antitoxin system